MVKPSIPGSIRKHLKPAHTRRSKSFDVALIILNNATPGRPIHTALALRRLPLRFKRRHARCRRKTIQRHVNQEGIASRSGRAGRGLEAFPIGSSRLIDVHVRIHQAGQNCGIAKVVDFESLRHLVGAHNFADAFRPPQESRRPEFLPE